jgi:hypothetical protein
MHRPGDAGSIHQHLKHSTLFIVSGDDDYRKFGHNCETLFSVLWQADNWSESSGLRFLLQSHS